jgi:hypothetical protein
MGCLAELTAWENALSAKGNHRLGISLRTRPILYHASFNGTFRHKPIFPWDTGVDRVIRLNGDDLSVSQPHLKDTGSETVISAIGVPDKILVMVITYHVLPHI